jgi:acyl-homoserine-lactone acylase
MNFQKLSSNAISRRLFAAVALATVTTLGGCGESSDDLSSFTGISTYSADIYRTAEGVPHVVAGDFGSIGFGQAYLDAQDNVCALSRRVLQLRGELSLNFGPGNERSDFFYKWLASNGTWDAAIDPEFEALFAGYAAGFNRYLRDTGVENLPDPECQGAEWISQISAQDVKNIHLTPAFLPNFLPLLFPTPPAIEMTAVGTDVPAEQVAKAKQPAAEQKPAPAIEMTGEMYALLEDITTQLDKGSNGVAIGRDLSTSQGGMLLTNPHLGPDLTFRFHMMHQIIPGVMNLLGASTYERANVGFGTNGSVAWTNTVSASRNFNWYRLDMAPGDPYSYLYDGEPRALQADTVTIEVLSADNTVSEESHTFYSTHYGPMLGLIFSWGTDHAYTMRIADEGARGFNNTAMAMQQAQSVRELKDLAAAVTHMPSTNIIAADASGETLYMDASPTPYFTDQQWEDCMTPEPGSRGPEFLGNGAACEWTIDPEAGEPGLVGPSNVPFLFRTDYVTNSNDSFWLANPNEPLTGVLSVYGDIEDERTLRTRSGLKIIAERIAGTDGLPGNQFDLDTLVGVLLGNQHLAGQLLRDDLVDLCEDNPTVDVDGDLVDISAACPVLANWDLAANLNSRGAHLFREFLRAADPDAERWLPSTLDYTVPFSVADPVNTPRGLAATNPNALVALAKAVTLLSDAGIALNAPLGDVQHVTRNGERIPMHGGEEFEGVFNKMSLDFDPGAQGYPEITGSSASWVMAVELSEQGVTAKGNLTYSQSLNTTSPNFSNMTKLWSEKTLVDLPYELEEVQAAAISSQSLSEGTDQCANSGWEDFEHPAFESENRCYEHFLSVYDSRLTDYVDD